MLYSRPIGNAAWAADGSPTAEYAGERTPATSASRSSGRSVAQSAPPRRWSPSGRNRRGVAQRAGLDRLGAVGRVPLHELLDQIIGEAGGAADLLFQFGVSDRHLAVDGGWHLPHRDAGAEDDVGGG